MIKKFCDACGCEYNGAIRFHEFRYLCHIEQEGVDGYTDGSLNRISGRNTTKDVCIECYNKILGSAFARYRGIQETRKSSKK